MSKRELTGVILFSGACLLAGAAHAGDASPPPALTLTAQPGAAQVAQALVLPAPNPDLFLLVDLPQPPDADAAQRARLRFAEAVARQAAARRRAAERTRDLAFAEPGPFDPAQERGQPAATRRTPPVWITIGNGF